MANDFFNDDGNPAYKGPLSSSPIRTLFAAVETGFDKLPGLTGNGGKIVAVNAGATAQEALSTTGTGNVVRATSPTLVTPVLGTPTSGTLTNCTGLPISTGISGLGTGVATGLASAVTGSGSPVLATSPTLVTPALGTPSSGDISNCTGTPTLTGTNISGTAASLTAGNATLAATATNAIKLNSTEVTVTAHATTGDIFAAAGNSILWDDSGGPVTTTIFPDAAQAGMVVECRCNAASSFTAGANLLIEGVTSGNTITLGAGAYFKVRAVTTTQFKMTYVYSGSSVLTTNAADFTASHQFTVTWIVSNGKVHLTPPSVFYAGDSISAFFRLDGLSTSVRGNTANRYTAVTFGTDGTNTFPVLGQISAAGELAFFTISTTTWPSSGTKGVIYPSTLTYDIN